MKNIIIIGVITFVLIITLIFIFKKKTPTPPSPPVPNPLADFMQGKLFLDQNNAHGDVITSFENISALDCKQACIDNKDCSGLTWVENGTCYLNKAGNYLNDGRSDEYAWIKR